MRIEIKPTIVFSSAGHLGRLLHHLPGLLSLEAAGGGGDLAGPAGKAHQVPEVRSAHPHHLVSQHLAVKRALAS